MAIFLVPLQKKGDWQLLKYKNIVPNQVAFSQEGMEIKVNKSASPLIFPLPKPMLIEEVELSGRLSGQIDLPPGVIQGEKAGDDYMLRFGMVLKGKKRLSFLERMLAADWILKLFELAPADWGVDRILFLNGTQIPKDMGKKRRHPASEYIEEHVVWRIPETGKYKLNHQFAQTHEVLALWLSSDGDDTQSRFSILFSRIALTYLN